MAVFSHVHPRCLSEDCVKPGLSLDVVIYRMGVASATVCSCLMRILYGLLLRKTLLVYCSCKCIHDAIISLVKFRVQDYPPLASIHPFFF